MPRANEFIPDLTLRTIDSGRIQLLNRLGAGSYGVVYRAVETTASSAGRRTFAVKCMLHGDDRKSSKVFKAHEVEAQLKVHEHANVLTIHDIIEEQDFVFIVCDNWTGGDLFKHVFKEHAFWRNDALVKSVFLQLLDALEFCHKRSVFHRDLKPDNILCSADLGEIALADFGLATLRPVTDKFGCGTSYYMSPECIREDVDVRAYSAGHSDIWSLGIILIGFLSGRVPWSKAVMSDPCFETYVKNPDFLRSYLPMSQEAERIIVRMLELNPHMRITITELKEEIKRVDTFFPSTDELAHASESVRSIAGSMDAQHLDHELEGIPSTVIRRVLGTRSRPADYSDSEEDIEPCSAEKRLWSIIDERLRRQCLTETNSEVEFPMRHGEAWAPAQEDIHWSPQQKPCSSTDCSAEGCVQAKKSAHQFWFSSTSSEKAERAPQAQAQLPHAWLAHASAVDPGAFVIGSSSGSEESNHPVTPDTVPIDPVVEVSELPESQRPEQRVVEVERRQKAIKGGPFISALRRALSLGHIVAAVIA